MFNLFYGFQLSLKYTRLVCFIQIFFLLDIVKVLYDEVLSA